MIQVGGVVILFNISVILLKKGPVKRTMVRRMVKKNKFKN